MKTKLFAHPEEEAQMTLMIAGIALHGLLSAGEGAVVSGMGGVGERQNKIVDASFDIALKFTTRAKELIR